MRRHLSARAGKDHLYKVLGIRHDALPAEVKAAFMTRAKKTHPDVNKHPDAERRFRELSQAYRVLSDPRKRKEYDAEMSGATTTRTAHAASGGGGARRTYGMWKRDVLYWVCAELNLGDPYAYGHRVQLQATEALDAARRTPRDLAPAKRFGHEHSTMLLGLTGATLLTAGTPIYLFIVYRILVVLDAHSDAMLKPGWLRGQVMQNWRAFVQRARGVQSLLRHRRG